MRLPCWLPADLLCSPYAPDKDFFSITEHLYEQSLGGWPEHKYRAGLDEACCMPHQQLCCKLSNHRLEVKH